MSDIEVYSPQFLDRLERFRKTMDELSDRWYHKVKKISESPTPKSRVYSRPDGYDYIPEKYMRLELDKNFPGWSWVGKDVQIITNTIPCWVIVSGTLKIRDNDLIIPGLSDGTREFFSVGAARIQYRTKEKIREERTLGGKTVYVEKEVEIPLESRYNPWHLIDLDKVVASANSNAFKRAVNRLCHIGDDVYGKRADDELTEEQLKTLNKLREEASDAVNMWIEERLDKVTPENFNRFINKIKQMMEEESNG